MEIDLSRVRILVTHRNSSAVPCPDGTSSAILARDSLPPMTRIVFVDHAGPDLRELPAETGMVFVDIAPPRDRVAEFRAVGAFVLDHHDKQKDIVEAFGERGVYSAEPGCSGAVLAYRYLWLPENMDRSLDVRAAAARFAELAGIRDTWRKDHPRWEEACEQAEALRLYPWGRFAEIEDPFGDDSDVLDELLAVGKPLRAKTLALAREALRNGWGFDVVGAPGREVLRVTVIPTLETSDAAEMTDADVLVGFAYRGPHRLTLSLRSRTGVDVGAVAKALGGGGHEGAAGCTVDSTNQNPFWTVQELLHPLLGR